VPDIRRALSSALPVSWYIVVVLLHVVFHHRARTHAQCVPKHDSKEKDLSSLRVWGRGISRLLLAERVVANITEGAVQTDHQHNDILALQRIVINVKLCSIVRV
jgi:hypothetical protein